MGLFERRYVLRCSWQESGSNCWLYDWKDVVFDLKELWGRTPSHIRCNSAYPQIKIITYILRRFTLNSAILSSKTQLNENGDIRWCTQPVSSMTVGRLALNEVDSASRYGTAGSKQADSLITPSMLRWSAPIIENCNSTTHIIHNRHENTNQPNNTTPFRTTPVIFRVSWWYSRLYLGNNGSPLYGQN